jgi:hypothetical protein
MSKRYTVDDMGLYLTSEIAKLHIRAVENESQKSDLSMKEPTDYMIAITDSVIAYYVASIDSEKFSRLDDRELSDLKAQLYNKLISILKVITIN